MDSYSESDSSLTEPLEPNAANENSDCSSARSQSEGRSSLEILKDLLAEERQTVARQQKDEHLKQLTRLRGVRVS